MKTHEENISLFISLGGKEKFANLYRSPSLANRARILQLVKELQKRSGNANLDSSPRNLDSLSQNLDSLPQKPAPVEPEAVLESSPSHKLLGFISQYPEALHEAYKKAFNSWLEACALKIKLNAVPPADEPAALEIQRAIYSTMKAFDAQKKILDYYQQERRILPTETETDFSKWSPLQLDKRLRTLRTLILKRTGTLVKLRQNLPEPTDPKYGLRIAAFNKKREELQRYEIDLQKITELLSG